MRRGRLAMVLLLLSADHASYRPKFHLSQLFRFPEPPLTIFKYFSIIIHPMNRVINQSILPIFVFSIILLREIISYLLFLFPGEEILWHISFSFGHKLLPIQLLIDNLISGFWGKICLFIILILIAIHGWISKNTFSKALSCHIAFILVCLYGLSSFVRVYSLSASLEPSLGYYVDLFGNQSVLLCFLMLSLLYGCVQFHLYYFQTLRDRTHK